MHARITQAPATHVSMRIRKPASAVYEAFADPAITTKFWFTHGSGRLDAGHDVEWTWAMYGASTRVHVTALEPGERIAIEWDGADGGRTAVEWTLTAHDDGSTQVEVRESGWNGDGDERVAWAADATQGFTWVLAAAKAWLEHGIELDVVADKAPDAHIADWPGATRIARGEFVVKLAPLTMEGQPEASRLGRLSIDKTITGDLEATTRGQMLSARTDTAGSAGYVALERVEGTLAGRRGSFVLQHTGTMNRGVPSLAVTVVPDSATDELAGLAGRFAIIIEGGKHRYEFRYTLPAIDAQ